jgi:hypothetical protein
VVPDFFPETQSFSPSLENRFSGPGVGRPAGLQVEHLVGETLSGWFGMKIAEVAPPVLPKGSVTS